jgi:hypothetical protein
MSEILRFNVGVPVEVALTHDNGVRVNGRYGEQVMYSLADDRVMYVPPYVERRIQELAIGPGEPIEICKTEVKNGSRRWIEWKVKRVDASQQPASSAKAPAAAANGVSKSANGHENGTTAPNGRDRTKVLTLEPEQLPMRMMASGLPAMEHALNTAIEIAQRVEGLQPPPLRLLEALRAGVRRTSEPVLLARFWALVRVARSHSRPAAASQA